MGKIRKTIGYIYPGRRGGRRRKMQLSGFNRNNGDFGHAEKITKSEITLVQTQKSRLPVSAVCTGGSYPALSVPSQRPHCPRGMKMTKADVCLYRPSHKSWICMPQAVFRYSLRHL